MAFKQPRVPDMPENANMTQYMRMIAMFLKDFCLDAWMANNRRKKESEAIRRRIDALEVAQKADDKPEGGE